MCKCTPEIRTPWCGKPGCEEPEEDKPGLDYMPCGCTRAPDGTIVAKHVDCSVHTLGEITFEFKPNWSVHPGEILRTDYLPQMRISVDEFARRIGIAPPRMTRILQGNWNLTAHDAARLGKFFGQTPEFWMNLQAAYDLAYVRREFGESLDRIEPFVWPEGAGRS